METLDLTFINYKGKNISIAKFRCLRCEDPAEFGAYLSAVRCLKPDSNDSSTTTSGGCNGFLLPQPPFESSASKKDDGDGGLKQSQESWKCSSCGAKIGSKTVREIVEEMKNKVHKTSYLQPIQESISTALTSFSHV